jgi:hypothetical protein
MSHEELAHFQSNLSKGIIVRGGIRRDSQFLRVSVAGFGFPDSGDDGNSIVIRVTAFAPSLLRW